MWKPSVVNWIFSVIVLGSVLIKRSVIKILMGKQLELPDVVWTRLSIAWGVFFFFNGPAEYVRRFLLPTGVS